MKLPKYCMWSGDYLYFRFRGELTSLPKDTESASFKREYERLLRMTKEAPQQIISRPMRPGDLDQHFAALERGAKQRAKRSGREYSLPKYWGADTYTAQDGICAISGLTMRKPVTPWDKHGPSIDRIDSSKGYTPENCQLVTFAVNRAKNEMSHDELVEICQAVMRNYRKTKAERNRKLKTASY